LSPAVESLFTSEPAPARRSPSRARTLAWESTTGTNTAAGTGTGSGQALTIYGRVPVQTTPAQGTYTDTIIGTITY
jgi:spore coat protein U-like protein